MYLYGRVEARHRRPAETRGSLPVGKRGKGGSREGNRRLPSRRSAAHCSLDGFLLLRGQRNGGAAAFQLLHVDPRVVAALDRRHDEASAGRVEQGKRGGLVAAGVLVGVVAD